MWGVGLGKRALLASDDSAYDLSILLVMGVGGSDVGWTGSSAAGHRRQGFDSTLRDGIPKSVSRAEVLHWSELPSVESGVGGFPIRSGGSLRRVSEISNVESEL